MCQLHPQLPWPRVLGAQAAPLDRTRGEAQTRPQSPGAPCPGWVALHHMLGLSTANPAPQVLQAGWRLPWGGLEKKGASESRNQPHHRHPPPKERPTDHGTVPEGLSQPMSWHQRSPPLPVTLGPVLFLDAVSPAMPSPVQGWRHSWSPQFPCPTCLRHPVPQLLSH